MPIITGIPTSIRRPQTFHTFIYQLSGRSLVPLPTRVALVGMKSSSGTATAEVPIECVDAEDTDAKFGIGSELALMCRKAFEVVAAIGFGPRIFAVPQAAPGGGVVATRTLTVTGTATADGNVEIRIAGRTLLVGVRTGDVQNTVATAINTAIQARYTDLPVTSGVVANVVTTSHVTAGENGNDVVVEVVSSVAGTSVVAANAVAGVGVVDITNALDALAPFEYDGVALANHKAADITDINSNLATVWSASEKRWRWIFVGERGSIGTATALAGAANHQGCIVNVCEGSPSLPGEISTAVCVGAWARERPNSNYDGMTLPLYPPSQSAAFIPSEVETALNAGVTPLSPVLDPQTRAIVDGALKVERLVTTKTTSGGGPFEPLRDLSTSRTGVYVARQIDVAYTSRFGAEGSPEGALLDDESIAQIRDMVANILFAAEDQRILKNVQDDLALLVVEEASSPVGRVNIDVSYTVVSPLHQAAFVHRVTV